MELLEKKRWTGVFFLPDGYDDRFAGEIEYCPETGISIDFRIPNAQLPNPEPVLHGVLSCGTRCTLVAPFWTLRKERAIGSNLASVAATLAFSHLLIGDHVSSDQQFHNVSLGFTNLNEFFFSAGFAGDVVFSPEPICRSLAAFGEIEFFYTASFQGLHDVRSYIHSSNAEAVEELAASIQEISERNADAFFQVRKGIDCRVCIKFETPTKADQVFKAVDDLLNLFALLCHTPVHATDMVFRERDRAELDLKVYRNIYLDPKTVAVSTRRTHNHVMPIKYSNIALDEVVANWFGVADAFSSVASCLQDLGTIQSERSIHANIVLHTTHLESIAYGADQTQNRYEFAIKTHSGIRVQEELMKVFSAPSIEEAAKAVGDLRNEIAHMLKPRDWLRRLLLPEISRVESLLKLTIVAYAMKEIGVPQLYIDEYLYKYVVTS